MPKKDTIVIDLDGTLSDCSARRYLVEGKHRDYEAFHARLGEDPVNRWCQELIKEVRSGGQLFVVVVSARPYSALWQTKTWLIGNSVLVDDIFLLRGEGDNTPAKELKRRWLHSYGKERVLFSVDDCPKVAKMWREEGVVCLHCASWENK